MSRIRRQEIETILENVGMVERYLQVVQEDLLVLLQDQQDSINRQQKGLARASTQGRMLGKKPDLKLYRRIQQCRDEGLSIRVTSDVLGCSTSTISRALSYLKDNPL